MPRCQSHRTQTTLVFRWATGSPMVVHDVYNRHDGPISIPSSAGRFIASDISAADMAVVQRWSFITFLRLRPGATERLSAAALGTHLSAVTGGCSRLREYDQPSGRFLL
jgi:hypothetical protein